MGPGLRLDGPASFADLPRVVAVRTIDDSETAERAATSAWRFQDVAYVGTAYHSSGVGSVETCAANVEDERDTATPDLSEPNSPADRRPALSAHGAPTRWQILSPPPPLAFCVQYDESDFEFVQRLLGRFGLFYYFDHAGDATDLATAETMVICQRNEDYAALARASASPVVLKLAEREGTTRTFETILRFEARQRAAPTIARQRDWDMRAPRSLADFAAPPAADHPAQRAQR